MRQRFKRGTAVSSGEQLLCNSGTPLLRAALQGKTRQQQRQQQQETSGRVWLDPVLIRDANAVAGIRVQVFHKAIVL
jgi:hypothetical protein